MSNAYITLHYLPSLEMVHCSKLRDQCSPAYVHGDREFPL